MGYLALYRKYRPKTFEDMCGQEPIVQTLTNQLKADRIAHAYLFSGPRGTGKTSTAKILAKAVNCLNPTPFGPCCQCEVCNMIDDKSTPDVVEIDAASNNGVDNIRQLIEESKYAPQNVKHKVYIIDEVHMLSKAAFDALLKTLEEPTKDVIFILATTEKHKVPATIFSRCQRYDFKLMSLNTIKDNLQDICISEGVKFEQGSLELVSKHAEGSMRDAISLLDQIMQFYSTGITTEGVREVLGEPNDEKVDRLAHYIDEDKIEEALSELKDIYMEGVSLSIVSESLYTRYKENIYNGTGNFHKAERCMRILAYLIEEIKQKNSSMGYTSFEIAVIKMCRPEMEEDYSSLYCRLQKVEQALEKVLEGGEIDFKPPTPIDKSEFLVLQYNQTCNVKLHIG